MRLLIFILLLSFSSSYFSQSNDSFTDKRNGKTYKTVTIDGITWMAENLNVVTFNNGDTIIEAKTKKEWQNARKNKIPAWCFYENFNENSTKNGRLYNFYALNDERGIAPEGWEIPSIKEFMRNENQLFNTEFKNGITLSGMRWGRRAKFQSLNYSSFIWSKTMNDVQSEWADGAYVFSFGSDGYCDFDGYDFGFGMSIRCIKKK
jgi:uncharacterized protein (TIGR02145 family)